MEKFLQPYDKEYMRMAMLKHEETFKEQVYELHRLYRVQKILMRNVNNNRGNASFSFNNSHAQQKTMMMKLDLERPADEYFAESNIGHHRGLEVIDESEIELTLGPTSYYNRRKKLETPLTSDSGPSLSSSSTGSSHMNRTSSLKTHQIISRQDLSGGGREVAGQLPDVTLGGKNITDVVDEEEQLRQDRVKQPPWLFQVFSLNMT